MAGNNIQHNKIIYKLFSAAIEFFKHKPPINDTISPANSPFRVKDLKGTKSNSSGTAATLIRKANAPRITTGIPSVKIDLNIIPFCCNPKINKQKRAIIKNFFKWL